MKKPSLKPLSKETKTVFLKQNASLDVRYENHEGKQPLQKSPALWLQLLNSCYKMGTKKSFKNVAVCDGPSFIPKLIWINTKLE